MCPGFLSVKPHGNLVTGGGPEDQGQISNTWPWLGFVEPWGLAYYYLKGLLEPPPPV